MPLEAEKIGTVMKLFVGNLAFACDEYALNQLFSHYGEVVFAEIMLAESGLSLMHGFVMFKKHSEAADAMSALQGFKFMGRCLRINWALDRSAEPVVDRLRSSWVQVHVSFIVQHIVLVQIPINEVLLDALFTQFGEVADVTIKHPLKAEPQKFSAGYGFVFFYKQSAAAKAVQYLCKKLMDGILFKCEFSRHSSSSLSSSQGDVSVNGPTPDSNLHIKGPCELFAQLISIPLVLPLPSKATNIAQSVSNGSLASNNEDSSSQILATNCNRLQESALQEKLSAGKWVRQQEGTQQPLPQLSVPPLALQYAAATAAVVMDQQVGSPGIMPTLQQQHQWSSPQPQSYSPLMMQEPEFASLVYHQYQVLYLPFQSMIYVGQPDGMDHAHHHGAHYPLSPLPHPSQFYHPQQHQQHGMVYRYSDKNANGNIV